MLDLRQPHPHFRILEKLTGEGALPGQIWPDRNAALVAAFGPGARVGHWLPHAPGLSTELQWHALPRDPEIFVTATWPELDGVFLSNPNTVDGSFMPDELYLRLLHHTLKNPKLRVVSEESLFAYRHDTRMPCGSARFLEAAPRLGLLHTLEAWDGRGGALLHMPGGPLAPVDLELEAGLATALGSLHTRSFVGSRELFRWVTLVGRALRTFTEVLQPLLLQRAIEVAHWPRAGHRLLLTLPPSRQGELFVKTLERDFGLQVGFGHEVGYPEGLWLDLAQPVTVSREAALRLSQALDGASRS